MCKDKNLFHNSGQRFWELGGIIAKEMEQSEWNEMELSELGINEGTGVRESKQR